MASSGVITRVPVHTGEVIAPGQTAVAVADLEAEHRVPLQLGAPQPQRERGAGRVQHEVEALAARQLEFLFEHQLQEKYIYAHEWSVGDVLMWENIGTIHNALADYGPDEPRYILRCQVMADKVFEEGFVGV